MSLRYGAAFGRSRLVIPGLKQLFTPMPAVVVFKPGVCSEGSVGSGLVPVVGVFAPVDVAHVTARDVLHLPPTQPRLERQFQVLPSPQFHAIVVPATEV